jgi:hypothetical protein
VGLGLAKGTGQVRIGVVWLGEVISGAVGRGLDKGSGFVPTPLYYFIVLPRLSKHPPLPSPTVFPHSKR